MTTKERNFDILDYIIRDYIETAEPVSSARICKKIRGEVSPATIRHVMGELNEDGYLEQPHTSAGRIPTDKAYRHFVDELLDKEMPSRSKKDARPAHNKNARDFVRTLAEELGMFAMLADRPDEIFWAGMEEIFKEPEFREHDVARAFISFVEHTPKRINYYYEYKGSLPHVLIGRENPFPEAVHFSSVFGRLNRSRVIIALGPKRMDYKHSMSIVRRFLE
ncbi:MAG: hypothetical protein HY445_01470 [Candidatus Niyogibacteria bacterium]|nr:hypothetical protein [Candidatus Niyogibacteria bacterium]